MLDEQTTAEQAQALEIARAMIKAGVPIFVARPNPEKPGRYFLPDGWQRTVPDERVLDSWHPGYGLGAVGGGICDFLDMDPRNGGTASAQELMDAGQWPRTFGVQSTPSGGRHYVISATGEHKATGFMPGLDLQAGGPDGQGRAFCWVAPTQGASKDPETLGQLVTYRWLEGPDLEGLEEFAGSDDSAEHIVARVHAARSRDRERETAVRDAGPFATASSLLRRDRAFTKAEAQEFCRDSLVELQEAPIGLIEERANAAAATLSHFVPAFWSVEQAFDILAANASMTAYDPNGPSDWRLEKFLPVLDGTRAPLDNWKATLREESITPPVIPPEVAAEGEQSRADWLMEQLVTAEELADRPAPVPLVYGLLDLDSEAWIIGAPGSFKSFVALDIAGHVGAGRMWQGHRVRQGLALYIAAEGAGGMVLRTRAWRQANGPMTGVRFLPLPIQAGRGEEWRALVEVCSRLQPRLVVIDTQARVTVGLEENSAKDFGVYADAVTAIRTVTGACVLTIHHVGRDGKNARGTSAIDGAQDTEIKLERAEPRSALAVMLKQDKQKDMADDGKPLELRLTPVDLGRDPETDRVLSSLVLLAPDAWRSAQGYASSGTALDVRPQVPDAIKAGTWKRHLLDILWDQAPAGRGMTVPALYGLLEAEYPDQLQPGRARRTGAITKAWKLLTEAVDSSGEPVISNVGGERWEVTSLEVRAALEAERGGGMS